MLGVSKFDKSLNGIKILSDGIITIKNGNINGVNNIDADNINVLEEKVDNINLNVTDNITKINEINNVKIPNLQTQITGNTISITTINNTTIPNIQSQITTNTNNINSNTLNIQGINTSLVNIEGDISTINGNFDNYYTINDSNIRYVNIFDFIPVQAQVNNNMNDINSITNTLIPNLQDQVNTINVVSLPNLQTQINTNKTNITSNTNSIYTINNVSLPNIQNQVNTINNTSIPNLQNQVNTINNTSIPNLQTQVNTINNTSIPNLNYKMLEFDNTLNAGNFNNVLVTSLFNSIEAPQNTQSDVFFTVTMNRDSNRQFLMNFPVAIRCTFNSNLISAINDLRLYNLVIIVYKNNVFFKEYIPEAINTPYGTIRNMSKPGTNNAGAQGYQYYGNFIFLFIPDYNNSSIGDIYNFHARPIFQFAEQGSSLVSLHLMINTNVNITYTQQEPINYNSPTSSGYQGFSITNQLPVTVPNSYLGCGLINYFPLLEIIMPVGYIYINSNNKSNPRFILGGFGTWEAINDKFLRGIDINNAGETIGASGALSGTNSIGNNNVVPFYNVVFYRRTS